MDPYLEDPVLWPGVHHRLIAYTGEALNRLLPPGYVADMGQRVYLVQRERSIYPDMLVLEQQAVTSPGRRGAAAVTLPEDPPWIVSLEPDEIREPFIEVLSLAPSRQVITVIEVLSPANKTAGHEGRQQYLAKQQELLASSASLLEIDLLRGGEHTVAVPQSELRKRGEWEYLACLHRGARRWKYEVWPIRLRDRLPRIRIPLAGGDPDVILDLQAVFERAYEAGAYTRLVDYRGDPPTPLAPAESEWAAELPRGAGRRE